MDGDPCEKDGARKMSIEKRLTTALHPIGWDIYNSVYAGKADRYLVIRHSDIPVKHGDDRPGCIRNLIYVDVYAPLGYNVISTVNAVKRALFHAGMTYPTSEDASDSDKCHIVIECEAISGVDLYGET